MTSRAGRADRRSGRGGTAPSAHRARRRAAEPAGRTTALPPLRAPGVRMPAWVAGFLRRWPPRPAGVRARMALAVALADENVARGTGGPFGAAVFAPGGRLVAVGVNVVEASGCSLWHAELAAIALAQHARGGYDLGAGGAALELVTSSEPCAMCFGALPWTGLRALVCGARAADAEAVGFDEGPKPARWVAALEARGIRVVRDVLRAEAAAVLRRYAARGGVVYGPAASRGRSGARRRRVTRSGPRGA